jgi:hypothetical protein
MGTAPRTGFGAGAIAVTTPGLEIVSTIGEVGPRALIRACQTGHVLPSPLDKSQIRR